MQNLNVKNSNLMAHLKGKSPLGTNSVKRNLSRKSIENSQIGDDDQDDISRGERLSAMGAVSNSV